MAKSKTLATLSVEALLEMRDSISEMLSTKAKEMRSQLSRLAGEEPKGTNGRKAHPAKGKKVQEKYRNPKTKATWAGRGVQPVWLREAVKQGASLESFAVAKRGRKAKHK